MHFRLFAVVTALVAAAQGCSSGSCQNQLLDPRRAEGEIERRYAVEANNQMRLQAYHAYIEQGSFELCYMAHSIDDSSSTWRELRINNGEVVAHIGFKRLKVLRLRIGTLRGYRWEPIEPEARLPSDELSLRAETEQHGEINF